MPDIRIIIALIVACLLFGAGWTVRGWKEAAIDHAIAETREAALNGAAEAIAKIKVENRTIYQKVQKEIVEKPVYRDCVHDPETLAKVNEALAP